MVPHEREEPCFSYHLETERGALRQTKQLRAIPARADGTLLAATWNLTNFGAQERSSDDLALMAEVIGWFDLIAVQEIAESLEDLHTLMDFLPDSYHVILSDIGGNDERAGFIYDSRKVRRLELAAEVAVPPSDQRYIRMQGVSGAFDGFDRNPYAVAFRAGGLEFIAVSAHLYFGSEAYFNVDRRALEAYALARWAEQRHKSSESYSQNILVMGDMNLTLKEDTNNVYRALKAKGMLLPEHSTAMGSSLSGENHYDQLLFHSGGMQAAFSGKAGVFDFDHAPFFARAWEAGADYFNKAVKYHIADHRPLWAEFAI